MAKVKIYKAEGYGAHFRSVEELADKVSSLEGKGGNVPLLFSAIGDSRMANSFQKLSGDAKRTRVMNQGMKLSYYR